MNNSRRSEGDTLMAPSFMAPNRPQRFSLISPKCLKKCCHLTLVSFSESDETESNSLSAKMQIFFNFFHRFSYQNGQKWVKKMGHFKLMSFSESDETESNSLSAKMQNFGSYFSLFSPIFLSKWAKMGKKNGPFQVDVIFRIKWNWIECTWCQNVKFFSFFQLFSYQNGKMGEKILSIEISVIFRIE